MNVACNPHDSPLHLSATQGILTAEEIPASGDVMLRITLLAAGFVIGALPGRWDASGAGRERLHVGYC